MGRGRAKAKQTKVARELKYSSHGTDLDALRAELAGERPSTAQDHVQDDDTDDDDPYADYAVDDDEDEDERDEATGGSSRR